MRVLNKRGSAPSPITGSCVFIGRPSKWGNPYSHQARSAIIRANLVSTREEAIKNYEAWIRQQPELLAALPELVDKDLVCFCAPKPCHGHVLIKLMLERGLIGECSWCHRIGSIKITATSVTYCSIECENTADD